VSLEQAAALIRAGKLVAFPTETVYGLGANALDPAAVARIFEAKGRPWTSPLIVHVDSVEMARGLASDWPDSAETLARRFWPGPLTLVVPKSASIPGIVTAGLATVGLRMPAHPLALELIRLAGMPIAAPSANRFTELSPTRAEHVPPGLADYVVDGAFAGGCAHAVAPRGDPADGDRGADRAGDRRARSDGGGAFVAGAASAPLLSHDAALSGGARRASAAIVRSVAAHRTGDACRPGGVRRGVI
jgi:tRNA threonylcarbamoyl adenosine modification protein (Sua5/YciO/YrdC/YwlC family)